MPLPAYRSTRQVDGAWIRSLKLLRASLALPEAQSPQCEDKWAQKPLPALLREQEINDSNVPFGSDNFLNEFRPRAAKGQGGSVLQASPG